MWKIMTSMPVLGLLAAGLLIAQSARNSEMQLKAAQHKAQVEGDLKGAIELYQKAISQSGCGCPLS